MNKQEKKQLETVLHDRIDELALELQNSAGLAARHDDDDARMDELITAEVDTAVQDTLQRNLRLLKRNLEWLDSPDGGYCQDCGDAIAMARLLAMPTTRTCIQCAQNKEQAS